MVEPSLKKRRPTSRPEGRPMSKKLRRQQAYWSGSSSESELEDQFVARDAPQEISTESVHKVPKKDVQVTILKKSTDLKHPERSLEADTSESDSDSEAEEAPSEDVETSTGASSSSDSEDSERDLGSSRKKTKRRDPEVFANSLAAILSAKLPSGKRQDPVLARSKDAQEANHEIADSRLEIKAKRKLREEKRLAKERGRVRDVLLGDRDASLAVTAGAENDDGAAMSAAQIVEQERRLRKTAQRGVVKLFNAVRAAQVRSEQTARSVRESGMIGKQQREEKVGEMGRQAFLDMVGSGGALK